MREGWGYQRMQEQNMRDGVGLPTHTSAEYEGRGGATNTHQCRI